MTQNMIQSMTGFGKSVAITKKGKLTIEMQSVNRRYLEITVSLPIGFSHLEMEIRKEIGSYVARGLVSIRIHFASLGDRGGFFPSFEQLKALKDGWESLAESLGFEKSSINLAFLLERMEESQVNEEITFDQIKKPLQEAIDEFVKSRKKEGSILFKEILKRIDSIEEITKLIYKKAPEVQEAMKQKLKLRFQELFPKEQELEERVLREAAILAEKCDITEELERLSSHFSQFRKIVSGDGKKMDFLLQEMGREVHTIGSKSSDLEIARLVVDLKAELEKAREQVQNIE